jgi:hypothetical protein
MEGLVLVVTFLATEGKSVTSKPFVVGVAEAGNNFVFFRA